MRRAAAWPEVLNPARAPRGRRWPSSSGGQLPSGDGPFSPKETNAMPTPIDTLTSLDDHPLVQVAWRAQRPEDERHAERATATLLETQWAALRALTPDDEPPDAVTARLTAITGMVLSAAGRYPALGGW